MGIDFIMITNPEISGMIMNVQTELKLNRVAGNSRFMTQRSVVQKYL